MNRVSPWVGVMFLVASLAACAAMGGAVAGLIYDRLTGRKP